MAPLIISGIASVANNLIEAWTNASQQKVAVEAAKFEGALNKALGPGGVPAASAAPATPADLAGQLRSKLLATPEVSSLLNAQDPAHPISLQVSTDGRLWAQSANGLPTEVALSSESQQLAQGLAALTAVNGSVAASAGPWNGTLHAAALGTR